MRTWRTKASWRSNSGPNTDEIFPDASVSSCRRSNRGPVGGAHAGGHGGFWARRGDAIELSALGWWRGVSSAMAEPLDPAPVASAIVDPGEPAEQQQPQEARVHVRLLPQEARCSATSFS